MTDDGAPSTAGVGESMAERRGGRRNYWRLLAGRGAPGGAGERAGGVSVGGDRRARPLFRGRSGISQLSIMNGHRWHAEKARTPHSPHS